MTAARTLFPRSPKFVPRGVGPLVLVGFCCFSKPALSTRIHPAQLYNTSVPANGVLRFTSLDDLTVVVLAADGSPVPGSFVAPGVWRPDEPFTLGTHTADLSLEANPVWPVQDAVFEVTAPIENGAEVVDLALTSLAEPDSERSLESVCCLAAAAPEPVLCVSTAYEARQVVVVTASTSEAMEWQLEISPVTTTQEGEFTRGHWPVTGSPAELCGVVEVFSWLDESTQLVRNCIANPEPKLGRIEQPVSGFGTTYDCTIPPAGHETLWCEERRYLCEPAPGGAHTEAALACEHYPRVCNGAAAVVQADSREQPAAQATNAGPASELNDEGDEDSEPGSQSADAMNGCAFHNSPVHATTARQSILMAFGLACAAIFRRRRRGGA